MKKQCEWCQGLFQPEHGNQRTHKGECRRKLDRANKLAAKRGDTHKKSYFIYAIGPATGFPIKIGYGCDPNHRLKMLQTGSWEPLKVFSCCYVRSKAAAIRMERLIHKKLDSGNNRKRGEWFNIFADDAMNVIREVFECQHRMEALKYQENWDDEKSSFYGYILG